MGQNLDALYQRYFNDLYYFLLSLCRHHHTAEDLLQETFFRAYLYLENYKGENVKTWLFTVAYRAFIDHYRKHQKMVIKEQDYFESLLGREQSPGDSLIVQEQVLDTINMIKDLPEKQKFAVLLRDVHEFSYREGSDIMNIKLSHFKVLLFRGRQAIRKRKEEKDA